MYKYEQAFSQIERPFAWLDYAALDHNIDFVNASAGNTPVRIATKSVRSVTMLRYIRERLHRCVGFMTFSAAETVYLLQQGFDELLLGYPVFEKDALLQIASFVAQGRRVTFMVDHVQQLTLLQDVATVSGVHLAVCIDLNVSTDYKVLYFGTKRSPLHSLETLQQFTAELAHFPQLYVAGCMAYDAQIAGVTDTNGVKGAVVRQLKKHSLTQLASFRDAAIHYLHEQFALQFVNAGGSGSMQLMRDVPGVTEVTVGSAFYAPALFSQYTSLALTPAVGFALRVTRLFSQNIIVCQGGGYIASGASGKDRLPSFLEPDVYSFTTLEGAGEVQTPIHVSNRTHQIGDTIYLRHAKAGELCEHFTQLHTTRAGRYTGAITTYRGDGQCFL